MNDFDNRAWFLLGKAKSLLGYVKAADKKSCDYIDELVQDINELIDDQADFIRACERKTKESKEA